jgi:hypothetical protein
MFLLPPFCFVELIHIGAETTNYVSPISSLVMTSISWILDLHVAGISVFFFRLSIFTWTP